MGAGLLAEPQIQGITIIQSWWNECMWLFQGPLEIKIIFGRSWLLGFKMSPIKPTGDATHRYIHLYIHDYSIGRFTVLLLQLLHVSWGSTFTLSKSDVRCSYGDGWTLLNRKEYGKHNQNQKSCRLLSFGMCFVKLQRVERSEPLYNVDCSATVNASV